MALTNSSQVTLPSLFESRALRSFWKKKTFNVKTKSVKLICMKCFIWKPYNLIQNILKWLMCTPSALSTMGSCRIQTKKLVYTSRLLNPANNQSGSRHTLCPSFLLLTSAKYPRLTFISWINRPREALRGSTFRCRFSVIVILFIQESVVGQWSSVT